MIKLIRCIIVIIVANIAVSFPQTVDKVLVSGEEGFEAHDSLVAKAFKQGYSSYDNTQFTGPTDLYPFNLQSSFDYADLNGYDIILRSYSGLDSDVIMLAANNTSIKLVMPSGSNSFQQTFTGDVINSPVIITGAGIDSNVTGYKIEFYSIDPITTDTLSSFANGYIAGQLSYIANTLGCSIDSARQLARSTGSNNGSFNYFSGFGKIIVGNAIAGSLPVELSSFTASFNEGKIVLEWKTDTEVNNYGFNIERSLSSLNVAWESIGFIEGHGNSNSPINYNYSDKNISKAGNYSYRLKQMDNDGSYKYSDIVNVSVSVPNIYFLGQNYPNPFNPNTNIDFRIPEKQSVTLKVYNALGEQVAELLNEENEAGSYSVMFDGSNLSSGIYIYSLETKDGVINKKMTILK